MSEKENWEIVIEPKNKWYQLDVASLWKYRDLLMLLVRRDFVAVYKQTILGPIWFFIQPIITTLTFTIIFGNIANISTNGTPSMLFYLSGITLWAYFADCLNKTSNTFVANAGVFGKVYFPRLIVPLSVLVSNLVKFAIQLILFMAIWLYYLATSDSVHPHYSYIVLFPILVIMMAGLGFGFGILISSLTTKYRDFTFLIGFGVQLLMYASPIVYPLNIVPDKYKWIVLANPVSSIIESFKYIFLGNGLFSWINLAYSFGFMLIVILLGMLTFSRVEKSFMDTV